MKKRISWHLILCTAVCILWLMAYNVVFGSDYTGLEAEKDAKEAQEQLQKEQRAHNEAVAEQNRIEVERAAAEKIAKQYAAMGTEIPVDLQAEEWDAGISTVKDNLSFVKTEVTPEEVWEQAAESGDFLALYENTAEKQERKKMTNDSLSALLESLTIAKSPLADEVYPLTEITYEELKKLFPINNGIFRKRDGMEGHVRYVDETEIFAFQYFWNGWYRTEGTVLTVRYGDINEQGNFTSVVLDTTQEVTKDFWGENKRFVDMFGYSRIADYNLGCEGLSSYLLKNQCLHVWDFLQLTGVKIDILDEKGRPKDGILCRSFDTEYGEITAFYYRNANSFKEYFAIIFEDHDTYDHILAQGETGGEMRIEIKLK